MNKAPMAPGTRFTYKHVGQGVTQNFEGEYVGPSEADSMWPLRVRTRGTRPFKTEWQEFTTEPEWFRQRGLTPPEVVRPCKHCRKPVTGYGYNFCGPACEYNYNPVSTR